MGAVRRLAAAAALFAASPAAAEPLDRYAAEIAEASRRFGVPADWIERVIRAESGGRTTSRGRPIVSRAGAMGLMQLMPGTWAEIRARLALGRDPHAPRDNILAGTFYLRELYDRFGYPALFAAYNAGPARYAAYLGGRSRLPAETRRYLASVTRGDLPSRPPPQTAGPAAAPAALFFVRAGPPADASTAPPAVSAAPQNSALFVIAPGR